MSIELKNIELVDRYLSGDLSAAEKQAFQSRLQSDSDLRELLSDFQATNELVKANEMAQIKAQLDSFSYEAAPWWQSTAAKYIGVAVVMTAVTTAVWMSSTSNEKPAAKETVAVVQKTESLKEQKIENSSSQKETPQQQTKIVVQPPHVDASPEREPSFNFPFVSPAITPETQVEEENAAPLTPVTTPTDPVAPPQRDSVKSTSKGTATTPADPQPEPAVVEAPVKRNFSIQLPTQTWTYPDYMKNGSLRIMNEAGALMNELNLNTSTDSWNGTDRYGNTVPSGLYFYQYTDASGQQYSGTITVIY